MTATNATRTSMMGAAVHQKEIKRGRFFLAADVTDATWHQRSLKTVGASLNSG